MTGLRLIAHGGDVNPDLAWLKSMGFDEFGFVVPDCGTIPAASRIHNAGITYATINPFNDGSGGIGAAGSQYAGQFSAMKNAGFDMIASEGCGSDVVRVGMNYLPWCNYGGYGCNGQCDVYTGNYAHPTTGSGGKYHVDYIETYCDGNCTMCTDSTIATMKAAVAAGNCAEVGILIGVFGNCDSWQTSSYWINVIDAARSQGVPCNNVLFWEGYDYDIVADLKGKANEVVTGLISHYGVRHGIGGAGGGTAGTAAPPTAAESFGGSTPACASQYASDVILYVRGTNGGTYYRSWDNGAWHNWVDLSGVAGSGTGPGAACWGGGALDIFVGGGGGAVYHKHGVMSTAGAYTWGTAWENLGGVTTSDCGAVSDASGNVYVLVRGSDGGMYLKGWYSGAWHDWENLGGTLLAGTGPCACSWGVGTLDTFVTGTTGAIYHKRITGGVWGGWENLGGVTSTTPGCAIGGSSTLAVFVRGTNGALYVKEYYGGAWHAWVELGGNIAAGTGPGACFMGGQYHVFVAGTDGAIYHTIGGPGGGSWSAWQNMGGAVTIGGTQAPGGSGAISPGSTASVGAGANIKISFKDTAGLTDSAAAGSTVTITGQAGYTDASGNWLPGQYYTGQLWKWSEQYPTMVSTDCGYVTPAADGSFSWDITDSVAEEVHYNVGFVAGDTVQGGTTVIVTPATPGTTTPGKTTTVAGYWKTGMVLITTAGCPFCAALESAVSAQGIPCTTVTDDPNYSVPRFPGVKLCNGTIIVTPAGVAETAAGESANAANLIAQMKAACWVAPTTTTTAATTTPGTAAVTSTTGGMLKPSKWAANELVMTWTDASSGSSSGTDTTAPAVTITPAPTAQTPVGYESPDVSLTPVLPVPAAAQGGITVVLRDHGKVKSAKQS